MPIGFLVLDVSVVVRRESHQTWWLPCLANLHPVVESTIYPPPGCTFKVCTAPIFVLFTVSALSFEIPPTSQENLFSPFHELVSTSAQWVLMFPKNKIRLEQQANQMPRHPAGRLEPQRFLTTHPECLCFLTLAGTLLSHRHLQCL
jgi:hypothetical protein